MLLEREKEKLTRPLDKLKLEELKKIDPLHYFVGDLKILDEVKELNRPINNRLKYTVFVDVLWFMGLIIYARNTQYYAEKYYPKKRRGIGNLLLISAFHCTMFVTTLFLGNCLALWTNPITFWKKSKDLNQRMIESDPYKGVTWTQFIMIYAEIEEVEEKKTELRKQLLNQPTAKV